MAPRGRAPWGGSGGRNRGGVSPAPRSPTPRPGSRLRHGCPGGVGRGAGARDLREPPRGRGPGERLPARPPGGRGEGPAAALFPRAPLRARPVERSARPAASMPPRRPAPPAPGGPRPAAPLPALLLLLLLLALQGSAAAPAGSEGPRDPAGQRHVELLHRLLWQAARAALHFFNFRAGSPHALRVLAAVQRSRAWVSAGAPGGRAGGRTDGRAGAGTAAHRGGGDARVRAQGRGHPGAAGSFICEAIHSPRGVSVPGRGVWGNGGTDPKGQA